MAITPSALVAEIRQYSGLKNNKFYTNTDIIGFASDALQELYDICVLAQEHYFTRNFDFTLAGGIGANSVLRPEDFFKQVLVERSPDTTQVQTVPMLSNEALKNRGSAGQWATSALPRCWNLQGDNLEILPPQNSSGDYRLIYVPMLETLVNPDPIDLTVTYANTPVNITVRLATSLPLQGDLILPFPATWFYSPNVLIAVVAGSYPNPLLIDGQELVLGDLILIQGPDTPIDFPLAMGIFTFDGLTNSGGSLQYLFRRVTGYEAGDEVTYGLKVKVTEGNVYGGAILVSKYPNWTVDTDTTDFVLSSAEPIQADLITTSPLTGSWSQLTADILQFSGVEDPDLIHIDGEDLTLSNLIYFTPDDAPIAPTNCGFWQFVLVQASSPILYYFLERPTGLRDGDIIAEGQNIYIRSGVTQRGVTFVAEKKIIIGTTTNVNLFALNQLDADTGKVVLQNAEFDPSYVDGLLTINQSPLGDRSYRIAEYIDESALILEAIDEALVTENFGAPTQILVTRQGERTSIPQALTPWVLFVKIHASIAIKTGREQSTTELERKLERERQRVTAMSANRKEDVTQAPITRNWRGRFNGGNGGGRY